MSQINQITQVRLPDGTAVGIVDWSQRTLFSTIDLLDGFTDVELYAFTYVQSDAVSASSNIATPRLATLMDTNIAQPGAMDATEEALVYSITAEVYQMSSANSNTITTSVGTTGLPVPRAATLTNLQRRLIVSLEVSQKDFYQASLGWFTAGFGPYISMANNGQAAYTSNAVNGVPGHNARLSSQIPVHIGGTEKFKLILSNPQGNAVGIVPDSGDAGTTFNYVSIRFNLDCLHKRATG